MFNFDPSSVCSDATCFNISPDRFVVRLTAILIIVFAPIIIGFTVLHYLNRKDK